MTAPAVHCSFDAMVKIGDLFAHPMNANVHPPDQIKKLARMIKYFGWRKPVTVSSLSGYIVRGHGRYLAAKEAGLVAVPVNYQDYSNDDEELMDLVADNKISELSEWLEGLSSDIVENLIGEGFDLSLTGFDIESYTERRDPAPLKKIDPNYFTIDRVHLPYLFKKIERNRIMKILNRHGNPARSLVDICKGV